MNGAPIKWYSKRQSTIKSSTFGSEFVVLKFATEMNDGLRYKLRMFGIPLDGPTNGFCDNESVVCNATIPESTLQKKHNSIAYHKCRKSVEHGALLIKHERCNFNCSDILTKFLPAPVHVQCSRCIMYNRRWGVRGALNNALEVRHRIRLIRTRPELDRPLVLLFSSFWFCTLATVLGDATVWQSGMDSLGLRDAFLEARLVVHF